MPKAFKKKYVAEDVYVAARERVAEIFKRFDTVAVSFSGGKDSTACLNICLDEARARGRLPLDVYFFDEEAIPPETVEYCERVRANPEIRFRWLCIPIKHRNACSRSEPFWYPYREEDRERWTRPLPENVERSVPGFRMGMSMPELAPYIYDKSTYGTVGDCRGLRAQESIRRHLVVSNAREANFISAHPIRGNYYPCSPIYDWTSLDVWYAPQRFGWDYNRAYDTMALCGIPLNEQRACPPFGEEPLGGLWKYATCWPDLWARMVGRCDGVATAARYARTELYGFGKIEPPDGMTWKQWTLSLLDMYPDPYKAQVAASIHGAIDWHRKKTKRPLHDSEPDALTGLSWAFIAVLAMRGDLKGRRIQNAISRSRISKEKYSGKISRQEADEQTVTLADADEGTRY